MVLLPIKQMIKVLGLDCRSWSDADTPKWLLEHKKDIKGELFFLQKTEGAVVSLLPFHNGINMCDLRLSDFGLTCAMNAATAIRQTRTRTHLHDGRMDTDIKVQFEVQVTPNAWHTVRQEGKSDRHIPTKQESYVLLHDGTDSLLVYAGTELPKVMVKLSQNTPLFA